ncbi:F0F1 ATP synthase subunit epsilon [Bryobacter aggregatus]|uniref:F0F1 ATP synthase subunit epsilon n=1 Tax=Bryobacter aggregatus TaxID=360054 RepID=UPI0004E238FE|nr:F0F1 ATP synthase subunit epsilon [Bryobacter aggregatus]
MADTFTIEIATPEKLVIRNEVTEAQIPGAEGMLGILPGHAALISEIDPGELSYKMDGQNHVLAVSKGWVEVSNNKVRVLVDACENATQIDRARAEEALRRANERLSSPKQELDMARALNAAKRAHARLAVAKNQ